MHVECFLLFIVAIKKKKKKNKFTVSDVPSECNSDKNNDTAVESQDILVEEEAKCQYSDVIYLVTTISSQKVLNLTTFCYTFGRKNVTGLSNVF